jgi:transglutaminase-like putative cysteine protease
MNAINKILLYQKEQKKRTYPKRNTHALDTRVPQYSIALIDTSIPMPISLDARMTEVINNEFFSIVDSKLRARKIFDWITENVSYGESKRNAFSVGYRTALETLAGNQGVCGEMAYVYVTLARASGLKSNYVRVSRDHTGKRVNHACAGVHLSNLILADPAYNAYDIHHTEFKEITDKEMITLFSDWRGA